MKLFITTQFKENYGAHDWDGTGECPQHWKFKGGEYYVVFLSPNENPEDVEEALKLLIEYSGTGSMEHIRHCTPLEDDEDLPFEIHPHVPICTIERNDNYEFVVTKAYLGEAWYGSGDYVGKTESWIMKPKGERADYTCQYIRNFNK